MTSSLSGKRILVTRPRDLGGKLVQKLEELGAVPILLPVTEIAPPLDPAPLRECLDRLEEFDWLIMTSRNGVEAVADHFIRDGRSLGDYSKLRIAVVGPATAAALLELAGKEPDAMPARFVSDEIVSIIPNLSGARVLLARGDLARPELPQMLSARGAVVMDVTAYRIVTTSAPTELLGETTPDAITMMSGESARATIEKLRESGLEEWLTAAPIACIGPVTAATVEKLRLSPAIVAEEHTIDGLLRSLETVFSRERVLA